MARPVPRNAEANFAISELFFSVTDLKGVILRGNDIFRRVSQYAESEILGKPHNIIRHPDMPKCVFKLLWDTIQAGKPIAAYVKNMAKDGSYYWVVAFVIPLGDRYLSVRMKPSSDIFKLIPDLYKAMLQAESTKGMDGGVAVLVENLQKLGFSGYEQFMRVMVSAEVRARDSQVNRDRTGSHSTALSSFSEEKAPACQIAFKSIRQESSEIEHVFFSYFKNLAEANKLGEEMKSKAVFFMDFGKRIKFLALNANLGAQRLGATGKTLSVVASQIQKTSFETIGSIEKLSQNLAEAVERIRTTEFQIGAARLLLEMLEFFSTEIINRNQCEGGDQSWLVEGHSKMADLREGMDLICRRALEDLRSLQGFIRTAESSLNTIVEVNASVGIVHVTGRTEAATANAMSEFDKTFHELQVLVNRSKSEIGALVSGMRVLQDQLSGLDDLESQVGLHLGAISSGVRKLAAIINPEETAANG